MSSILDPVVRERLFELDKEQPVSADKAKLKLGWSPRANDDAIVATAKRLIDEGLVKR